VTNPDHLIPEHGHLLGKRVNVEGLGVGTIRDVTRTTVGILLDGCGCRVSYVPIRALMPIATAEREAASDGLHQPRLRDRST
jgi:hypothetical protein